MIYMNSEAQHSIYSVSEFLDSLNTSLSQEVFYVKGEVSDYKIIQNRYVVFDVKDEKGKMNCFLMFYQLEVQIEDGMEIVVKGLPHIYIPQGRFSFRVIGIEPVGEGALKRALILTKRKLEKEGLFDERYKAAPPSVPETIGLVTSQDAAAYTDVLRILTNRWSGLTIYFHHASVQGERAVAEIVDALDWFNKYRPVDVIIVTRGGGSLEDLQAFNSEAVCRAVFASHMPIITGVGHERDVTLVDLVADVRASTPSNAAEIAVPDKVTFVSQLLITRQQLRSHLFRILDDVQRNVYTIFERLQRILADRTEFFALLTRRLDALKRTFSYTLQQSLLFLSQHRLRLQRSLTQSLSMYTQQLRFRQQTLTHLHPQFPLQRGFSLTRDASGKILRHASDVHIGDLIRTELQDGSIQSHVRNLKLDT
ncbi:MAG: exodeoxyribonuclease VII large subunit [Candidatus Kerfeldbacteria bacterium RIFCSPHIGHO2_02_FULL_42_14]|uniref:Exodeoxyribonuclease 7 large subunit n=1 Tax=Candidatus Kerfeldbacteria bacterium RIFCSPHIGHO2_02_FULL_42_14 TaxID=1798540 RepID=A0A1G2AQS0_9BACT|nr:MAG: exodeoxyribonuclease VII large subunit [Candidatus Kerfeldbacteria bacterium RIFCSPHIGHO2_02_FULL_42_14]OGY81313.1 MAG: exodeoxyribonuclease VII large subunit [Candidatus Kerfeldbacteria bacterium RIFCSPHIGHO2_12_FULL_42_13]OGY83587.1 MAG: exodeoxyribonuclease VII large subunit [Candidatus Kerfeldbacteria bacterium RIFCSPLOWO2_02_FULL_42_19]OGY86699.1 MAG: exodeoxyribonuclease VII large subunit [Candidatus Kerfeldbacteria bacterium RIFCSPLOWO2_12_FULL_43_9]